MKHRRGLSRPGRPIATLADHTRDKTTGNYVTSGRSISRER